jgi:hypothetical protein
MTYENLYYTDNHEHAAYLMASKQVLESFYWNRGACVFVFENELECDRIITSILRGDYFIEALSLVEALKAIHGIINLNI